LLRFNCVDQGQLLFDGKDLSRVSARDLRQQVALVPQRSSVFSGTIADAIRFGRDCTQEELQQSAKLANAHDFIVRLPDGYDTRLQERGTNVSGGQLQRIAIARAVLGNPAVMLLDEATSALDAEAEAAVQLGLKQAMAGRTVLVIAHRLATVQEADQIVLMERGSIVDVGTHDALMQRGGRYRELCEKQFIRDLQTG
jgi:ATP-binding cassette subfamily B protein